MYPPPPTHARSRTHTRTRLTHTRITRFITRDPTATVLDAPPEPSQSGFVGSDADAGAPAVLGLFNKKVTTMSSKTFEGKVSVVLNTKGEIALKRDSEGAWDASQARELHTKIVELAKQRKTGINQYSLWIAPNGTEPVLLANRYGNPYIALLPKREDSGPKQKVTKLA